MIKRSLQEKWDQDLVVCTGTDIPPLGIIELMMWERIIELIDKNKTNILNMNDIFEGFNHTRSGRFDLISRLVKNKVIKRKRIASDLHEYTIIPKNTYKESTEMRVYKPKSRSERLSLIKEFSMSI